MSWSSNTGRLRPCSAYLALLQIIVATLCFSVRTSSARFVLNRLPASPGYQGRSTACPARCAVLRPNSANWSLYHNFEQFTSCQESLFYSFSLLDPVDDPDTVHRIYTCTSFGPDWGNLPVNTSSLRAQSAGDVNGTYEVGSWPSAPGSFVSSSLATLIRQFRQYLSNGFGSMNRPTVLFASYGSTSVGLYIGPGLQKHGIGDTALAYLEDSLAISNFSYSPRVAMQFCQPGQSSHHIFGLIATGNGMFAPVQDALTSWSKAECLNFPLVQNVTGIVPLMTPLLSTSFPTNITRANSTMTHRNATST